MPHIHKPMPIVFSIRDLHRFWNKIERTETCWLWTGGGTTTPYNEIVGQFNLQGYRYNACRVAYYFEYKIDPGQQLVLHECNVSLCVRPAHLHLGSYSDNMRDRADSRRQRQEGSWHPRAKLHESQIPSIIKRHDNGELPSSIARSLGVDPATIYSITTGQSWKHVPRN